jgi:hypothetical protein
MIPAVMMVKPATVFLSFTGSLVVLVVNEALSENK